MTNSINRERYCLYFPDDGRYTAAMTLKAAKELLRQFNYAYLVNIETAEVWF